MTYAGRLDPMAEGELLILVGDECKNKEKYLGLNKEYEVEIVFGIETDTYDALGLALVRSDKTPKPVSLSGEGKFIQEYPPYSSKTVNGKQLHELARAGELPDGMPVKEVEIYSMQTLSEGTIQAEQLKTRIFSMIHKVKGDFRQQEIKQRWEEVLVGSEEFPTVAIRVKCSSGTYMRSLAHRMGGFALTIKRTNIFL